MTRMETRNGPSEPPSSATQRWCGLSSGSCRPDVATARRAGWRRPQETATVRGRAGPLLSALARVQKTREAPFGTSPKSGRAAAVAGRILASHNRTIPRLFSLSAAPATVLQPCATDQITKRRAALLQTKKAAASNFAPPAQVDTMRQTVLALAICGHAAALQPARAPRQSLAVRQAPRGVRQRVLDGVRVEDRESRRHRRDDSTA